MSLQQNINSSIFSLTHLGAMKKQYDLTKKVLDPEDLYSDDTKTEMKNMNSAIKKVRKGKTTLDEKGKESLMNHIKEYEARAYGSPLPEYTPYGVSKPVPDESGGMSKMDPLLAQRKAEKAIADKQMEYEIAKGGVPQTGKMDPIMSHAKSDTYTHKDNKFVKEE